MRRVHEAYQFLAQKYLARRKKKAEEEQQGPNSNTYKNVGHVLGQVFDPTFGQWAMAVHPVWFITDTL